MSPDDFELASPPITRSYEIVATRADRPDPYLVYCATDERDSEPKPGRFVSANQAHSVARSLQDIETCGRTFFVAPSSEDAPHFSGRIIEAI